MKFGIRYSDTDLDTILAIAKAAETAGLESLWRGEHVLTPRVIESIDPYYARALPPGMERFPSLDPTTLAAHLAGHTERLRFCMGVNILALHVPYQLARTLATADVVSGGRIEMAVGVGWLREEFDILGVDWRTRGKRTNEAMAVLRTLWRDPHPEFHGEHFDLPPVTFRPKPVQPGGPPLLVAGLSNPAFRRAATMGDGWYGHDLSVGEAAAIIARIDALRDEHGTKDRPFTYTTRAGWDVSAKEVEAFASHGVGRLVLDVGSAGVNGLDSVLEKIERIGRDLVGQLGESDT